MSSACSSPSLKASPLLQSRIQGFGGSSSSATPISSQGGNAAPSSSSGRMTGFGNPRFEGVGKKSSSVGGMNVTSPKALLGAISTAAGFSNPTRQQLERSLSQDKARTSPWLKLKEILLPCAFLLSLSVTTVSAACLSRLRVLLVHCLHSAKLDTIIMIAARQDAVLWRTSCLSVIPSGCLAIWRPEHQHAVLQ